MARGELVNPLPRGSAERTGAQGAIEEMGPAGRVKTPDYGRDERALGLGRVQEDYVVGQAHDLILPVGTAGRRRRTRRLSNTSTTPTCRARSVVRLGHTG